MDNNVLASCQFDKIIEEVKKAGFTNDSVFVEPNLLKEYTAKKEVILETYEVVKPYFEEMYSKKRPRKRFVDFNQGIDARLITDTNMRKLFEIPIRPVRIAFDHWELNISIYSFPMKYHPIEDPDYFSNRDYIGEK